MDNKKEYITLEMYLMGRDKQYPEEFTDELKNNAIQLLDKVNGFLSELKPSQPLSVTSGWRPRSINAKTPGAAKKSLHMECKAVDLSDNDLGDLDKLFESKPDLLRKYGLFLEDPNSTPRWAHLDCGNRTDRPSRVFKIK